MTKKKNNHQQISKLFTEQININIASDKWDSPGRAHLSGHISKARIPSEGT